MRYDGIMEEIMDIIGEDVEFDFLVIRDEAVSVMRMIRNHLNRMEASFKSCTDSFPGVYDEMYEVWEDYLEKGIPDVLEIADMLQKKKDKYSKIRNDVINFRSRRMSGSSVDGVRELIKFNEHRMNNYSDSDKFRSDRDILGEILWMRLIGSGYLMIIRMDTEKLLGGIEKVEEKYECEGTFEKAYMVASRVKVGKAKVAPDAS